MSQNTDTSMTLNNTELNALFAKLAAGQAEGKTMDDLDSIGSDLDVLTVDWPLAARVEIYNKVRDIFNVDKGVADSVLNMHGIKTEAVEVATEVQASVKDAAHKVGNKLDEVVHSRQAVTAGRVLKTVGKVALVGSGVGLVAMGGLYAYRRFWGGSETEPVIDITVNS